MTIVSLGANLVSDITDTVKSAYDVAVDWALRPELIFDQFVDKKPTAQSMNGSAVIFTLFNDLAVASTALNESIDVTPASLTDSTVTVTLSEYGNAVKTSAKARGTTFATPFDPVVGNAVGYNAGISIDTVVRDVAKVGTNVIYGSGGTTTPTARANVTPDDDIDTPDVRKVVAQLRGANVATWDGGSYAGVIHPDVSYDLRGAAANGEWFTPAAYSDATRIWNGEIGTLLGVRFVENSRAPVFADAGSSTTLTDTYRTLIFGRQALAKAFSLAPGFGQTPQVEMTPVIDALRRFTGVGWYHLVGYGIYRQAALRSIESASTIGANA